MEQIKQHVIRRARNVLAHQVYATHDLREFMHRDADKIEFAGNRAIVRIIGVTKSAAERKRAVVCQIVLSEAQRLRFGSAKHVNVVGGNWIARRQRTTRAQNRGVVSRMRIARHGGSQR